MQPDLSVVIPVFNEAANVRPMLERLTAALRPLSLRYEILFVDDGSRDHTAQEVGRAATLDPAVRLLSLTRNFGHQAALFAGLDYSVGSAVITLDGDLQHPPELIPQLVREWQAGAEIVQAVRRAPADAAAHKRITSRWFYRILSAVSRIQVTPGAADFRLMSREAVDAFLSCRERCRFNRGLVHWIGFTQREVLYDAEPRHAGHSKYSLRSMLRLAGDAIFSFSAWPLRLAGLAGAIVSLVAGCYLLFVLWARLFTDRTVEGWSSTLATVLILGGMQLVVLWIMGEYLGRMFEEVKQRPIYIVRSASPAGRSERRADASQHATAAARSTDQMSQH